MSDHDSRTPREDLIRAVFPAVEFRDASDSNLGAGYLGLLRILFSPVNEWAEIRSTWEGNFMERFAPGAWKRTISNNASKIRALFQHGMDPQIGDKPLGPIRLLEEGEHGGYGEVALLDTSYNRDLLPGLKEGLYGASHRFGVLREEVVDHPEPSESNPRGLPEHTIKEARLAEFGPVTFPAYAGATAGVRAFTDELLMRCFERDPVRLQLMFDEFEQQRMDAEDLGLLAQMTMLGTDYLAEQDEASDGSAIAGMQAVLTQLHDLSHIEVTETEPVEPMEPMDQMMSHALSEDESAAVPHLTDEPREQHPDGPATATRKATTNYLRKEKPSWLIPSR